jgi:hypothetical protein
MEVAMDFTELITDQVAAVRRPLFAVTVAAVPRPDTPVILTLHWHGFVAERLANIPGARAIRHSSIPSTALQLNARWRELLAVDLATLDAGWQFGAWDVTRVERPPHNRLGARTDETLDCMKAFGAYDADEFVVTDTPDADDLVSLAGRAGYLYWLFRPVKGGLWSEVASDATLDADGTRKPPCPILPEAPRLSGHRRTVYRFGAGLNIAIR